MKSRYFWRFVFVVMLLVVTRMTLTTNPDDTKAGFKFVQLIAQALFNDPAMSDKVAHFISYFALGVSALFAEVRLWGRQVPVIALIALYGGVLELLQGAGGVRTPDLADALANASGALSAYVGGLLTQRLTQRRRLA